MHLLFDAITILVLLFIIIQDARQRQISWALIPLLLLSILSGAVFQSSLQQASRYFALNLSFLLAQFILLLIYLRVRKGKQVKILDSFIGTGDILLFLVLCAGFSPMNFLLFYSASLFFSLVGYATFSAIRQKADPTIPLAGTVAICLVIAIGIKNIYGYNFYDDGLLISLMSAGA